MTAVCMHRIVLLHERTLMTKTSVRKNGISQKAAIGSLFAAAGLIVIMGLGFAVFGAVNHLSLYVLNAEIPSALFGIVIAFLGIRNLFAVHRLSKRITAEGGEFSWQNFRSAGK